MENEQVKKKSGITLKTINIIIGVLAVVGAIFHIYIAYSTQISVIQQRVFHVFLFILIYYLYKVRDRLKDGKKIYVVYFILALLTLVTGVYYLMGTTVKGMMQIGIQGINKVDVVFGVILMILILDITRKTIGMALAIIAIIFVLYAIFGPYMPEVIAHRGYKIPYITSYVAWTLEGIFGTPVGASVSFVALYIIFGELLDQFGAGKFFIDIAYALTGRMRGGPAESSVVSSALMGSINGSAVANVVTTGTFTIPLMKKVGYSPVFAGAVEAVASTGGQLLPPVMGAAAFVMADMTGIPYSKIIIAAAIPGILYYVGLGITVYLEAGKLGLKPEPKENLPKVWKVLKEGWYQLIPLVALIVALLGFKLSANYAAI
jgi:TRAP transporter 4TM/12TM fusion protein